jgi:hypothetical protein
LNFIFHYLSPFIPGFHIEAIAFSNSRLYVAP